MKYPSIVARHRSFRYAGMDVTVTCDFSVGCFLHTRFLRTDFAGTLSMHFIQPVLIEVQWGPDFGPRRDGEFWRHKKSWNMFNMTWSRSELGSCTYRAILTDQNDITQEQRRADHGLNSKLQIWPCKITAAMARNHSNSSIDGCWDTYTQFHFEKLKETL